MYYSYSKATDFNGKFNARQFHMAIKTSNINSATFQFIETTGDIIKLWFSAALSVGDQSVLNGLISAHSTVAVVAVEKMTGILSFSLLSKKVSHSTYKIVGAGYYLGSAAMGTIKKIYVVACSKSSYALKIIDVTNAKTIAEKTNINNSDNQAVELNPLGNVPIDAAQLEVCAKTEDDDVHIRSITVVI